MKHVINHFQRMACCHLLNRKYTLNTQHLFKSFTYVDYVMFMAEYHYYRNTMLAEYNKVDIPGGQTCRLN